MTALRPDRYDRAGLPRLVIFHLEGTAREVGEELAAFLRAAEVCVAVMAGGVGAPVEALRRDLAAAGTRDAVLVGAGAADAEAAAGNGVPFVQFGRPGAGAVVVDAVGSTAAELLERLRERPRLLRSLEVLLEGSGRIGVTGPAGVGKTLLAARLADLLGADLLATDDFLSGRSGPPPGGDHLAHAFDLPSLRGELARGSAPRVTEGIFLEDPRLRPGFDRIVHLRADDAAVVRRIRGRDGEVEAAAVRDRYLPAWRAFPPHWLADEGRLVVDMTRLLQPKLIAGLPISPG